MKYPKWISIGRREKAKDDVASIGDFRDGSKFIQWHDDGNSKQSILEESLSPIDFSPQRVIDIFNNVAIEYSREISENKTPILIPSRASFTSKRKSWYSTSSKVFGKDKSSIIDHASLYDQTEALKDWKVSASQSAKNARKCMPETPSNDTITIIVTSPTSDMNAKDEDSSFISSNASSLSLLSLSSTSSTSSLDATRLMPPSTSPSTNKYPKPNEPLEVKKWLIGCMNRKADTLPLKLVYRMMEIYSIEEDELDPRMLNKLREGIEDEGVVLQAEIESEDSRNNKEEFDGVEALKSLRTSFRSQIQSEGKENRDGKGISEHFNDTVTVKRGSKNNDNPKSKEQIPVKKVVPGANPRVWQKPSSRSRNWPTTNTNISNGSPFAFPPCTNSPMNSRHRNSSKSHKSCPPGSKKFFSTSEYSKRGICPPRRGSVISLSSIPEHDVSAGFDNNRARHRDAKPQSRSESSASANLLAKKNTESKRSKATGERRK